MWEILRDVLKEIAIAVAIVAVPVSWASLAIVVVNDKWPDSAYAAQRVPQTKLQSVWPVTYTYKGAKP